MRFRNSDRVVFFECAMQEGQCETGVRTAEQPGSRVVDQPLRFAEVPDSIHLIASRWRCGRAYNLPLTGQVTPMPDSGLASAVKWLWSNDLQVDCVGDEMRQQPARGRMPLATGLRLLDDFDPQIQTLGRRVRAHRRIRTAARTRCQVACERLICAPEDGPDPRTESALEAAVNRSRVRASFFRSNPGQCDVRPAVGRSDKCWQRERMAQVKVAQRRRNGGQP
jgi:hypothetical protein